tara:strand:- start:175 stop:774 length:600 start_codon:yes stop_codon:yes gene_type:complete
MMRKLLAALVLGLFLITPSQADDIQDFQIEGISIGDSALDHFSEEQIKSKKNSYEDKGYIYPSREYYAITFNNLTQFETYDDVQFHLKDKDKTYKIYSVMGIINYRNNNINACYQKLDLIEKELDDLFKSAIKGDRYTYNHAHDKSGKSKVTAFNYKFDSNDTIYVSCADWSEKTKISDALRISLSAGTFEIWMNNVYK